SEDSLHRRRAHRRRRRSPRPILATVASAIGIDFPIADIDRTAKATFSAAARIAARAPSPPTRRRNANAHSTAPLLTAAALSAASSLEDWTTPALRVAASARAYTRTARHRPILNEGLSRSRGRAAILRCRVARIR